MGMEFEEIDFEETASQTGMKWLGRVLAIITILVVAAFGDIMYIQLMSSHFPSGPLLVLCYIGAFTSFLAIVYMLIGKSILFTPGRQMVLAWLIFGLELALIALNIILVFQNDGANSTGFLAVWLQAAPATPVLNMAGVAILFFLDEDGRVRHEDMELAWEVKRAARRHFKAMHRARMRLQNKQLNYLVTSLERAVASPESLSTIEQTAIDLNTTLLSQLSGRSYPQPQIGPPAARPVHSQNRSPETLSREEAARIDAKAVPADVPNPKKGGRVTRAWKAITGNDDREPVVQAEPAPAPAQPTAVPAQPVPEPAQPAQPAAPVPAQPVPVPAQASGRSRVAAKRLRRLQRLHARPAKGAANNGNSFRGQR